MRSKVQKAVAKKLLKKPRGKLELIRGGARRPIWVTRAYANNRYTILIDDKAQMTHDVTAILAMVQRRDDKPIPNHWREMQAIKNELFGVEATGIEYYPAESELEDEHNIYWLWILPENVLPKRVS